MSNHPRKVLLGTGTAIGEGEPPYIIAEIGSNWETIKQCVHAIQQAKIAGANAVKFQLFDSESLWGMKSYDPRIDIRCQVLRGELAMLRSKAAAVGIDFMCSAFSPELVTRVNPYVIAHKVASAEATHVRILERIRDSGKPVFLSTGATGEGDVERALTILDGIPVVLMYCLAAYPAMAVDLERIREMADAYHVPIGFSDHTLDWNLTPKSAVAAGACVIEKHLNVDGVVSEDSPHSLSVDEFKDMVTSVRGGRIEMNRIDRQEREFILRHNRRLIVTASVRSGDTLLEGVNFGIFRSLKDDTKGLNPWAIARVHGKKAAREMWVGDSIGPEDFQA